jgi:hypothetical protein
MTPKALSLSSLNSLISDPPPYCEIDYIVR